MGTDKRVRVQVKSAIPELTPSASDTGTGIDVNLRVRAAHSSNFDTLKPRLHHKKHDVCHRNVVQLRDLRQRIAVVLLFGCIL